MKNKILYIILGLTFAISGCEEEKEVQCFPVKIKTTISQGTGATSTIADYKYVGDTLDHINFSNFQSHFYYYNESGQLEVVSRKNMQTYEKIESRYTYQAGLPVRSDEYIISFDRVTQEDKETIHTGYREFNYTGDALTEERVYVRAQDTEDFTLSEINEHTFDLVGNIIKSVAFGQPEGDTVSAYTFAYDNLKNTFSSLELFEPGETYINNLVVKKDLLSGDSLTYQNIYNPSNFPTQVNIKEMSYLSEIITIEYTCK